MVLVGLLATLGVLMCERWCLRVFCGVYGGKGTTKVLKTVRGLEGTSVFILQYSVSLDSCFSLSFYNQ
jgi:hypothetical protein